MIMPPPSLSLSLSVSLFLSFSLYSPLYSPLYFVTICTALPNFYFKLHRWTYGIILLRVIIVKIQWTLDKENAHGSPELKLPSTYIYSSYNAYRA